MTDDEKLQEIIIMSRTPAEAATAAFYLGYSAGREECVANFVALIRATADGAALAKSSDN